MSDRGSLLAMDRYASEESIRVAVYGRALTFSRVVKRPPPVGDIAQAFVDFVGDDGWRLDALDVALDGVSRVQSMKSLLETAGEVAAWAVPPTVAAPAAVARAQQPAPAVAKPVARGKATRKRR